MKEVNDEYYRQFRILFERHAPDLLPEFDEKVRTIHGLQVFHWLLSLQETREKLWESLDPLMTDFFCFNH